MELMAAIEGLNALKRSCAVELFTDSEYLKKGIPTWLPQWKKRGFRTIDGEPIKNQDLWQRLEQAAGRHKVHWKWVGGQVGNPMNELCDRLAKDAIGNGLNPIVAENCCVLSPIIEARGNGMFVLTTSSVVG
jgi:ribonuclease HI